MARCQHSLRLYGIHNVDSIPQIEGLSRDQRFALEVVAQVLPFRTNNYVVNELIDWSDIPDDPIYQLNFMQRAMLDPHHFDVIAALLKRNASRAELTAEANRIRRELNPHPDGQMTTNIPVMDDERVPGIQHKYQETCLVFPASGQTCHAYCTFCFRWPQFVGEADLKFATDQSRRFQDYIRKHLELTDVLFTGGDPLIMSARKLGTFVRPLLGPGFDHIQTIRIGTKAIAYWPYRFISDGDATDLLSLFEDVVKAGKHLALMAHFNHWRETSTRSSREAIRRIGNTGAEIRTQSPLIRHINDDARVWRKMWKDQVRLGCIPYYMFVERETGANIYFSVPLARAFRIFRAAYVRLSGLARTVRGPSMSADPGKVSVDGVTTLQGEKVFVLSLIQARNPDWCMRPFFAKFDREARWLDDLEPALGAESFFFERPRSRKIREKRRQKRTSLFHRNSTFFGSVS
ncbi:MAG: KamA family radical SAM protein [Fidelibacterota bacterium]